MAAKRCAQCGAANDCGPSETCEKGVCKKFVACASDKQCKAAGLMCDTAKGKCAQCVANTDCPAAYHCSMSGVGGTGACKLDVCTGASGACAGNTISVCDDAGAAWSPPKLCPAQTSCMQANGKAACKPWVCTPGVACSSAKAVTCSADGLQVLAVSDCAAGGQNCVGGACKPAVCQPAALSCNGKDVVQCANDGTAATVVKTCGAGEYCAAGACKAGICASGKAVCNGEVATTCNADGSGYQGAGTDCTKSGQVCFDGACKAKVCDMGQPLLCDNKTVMQCANKGTATTKVGTCAISEYCAAGACKPQVCTPGSTWCDAALVKTCAPDGSGPQAGATDCAAAGKGCQQGACVAPTTCVPDQWTVYCGPELAAKATAEAIVDVDPVSKGPSGCDYPIGTPACSHCQYDASCGTATGATAKTVPANSKLAPECAQAMDMNLGKPYAQFKVPAAKEACASVVAVELVGRVSKMYQRGVILRLAFKGGAKVVMSRWVWNTASEAAVDVQAYATDAASWLIKQPRVWGWYLGASPTEFFKLSIALDRQSGKLTVAFHRPEVAKTWTQEYTLPALAKVGAPSLEVAAWGEQPNKIPIDAQWLAIRASAPIY
jgi:hypothetical protein